MPKYDYLCEANQKIVEVHHDINTKLKTWGEVCFASQTALGDTDILSPVRLVIRPIAINVPTGNSKLKEHGFTKLVKRDDGVYENMTATGNEKRYMVAGDKSSMPHLHKKISS
jgi:hypothetical protein